MIFLSLYLCPYRKQMQHYKMHILGWVVRWFGVVGHSVTNFECIKQQFPPDNFDKILNFIIDYFEIKDNFDINEMEQMTNV